MVFIKNLRNLNFINDITTNLINSDIINQNGNQVVSLAEPPLFKTNETISLNINTSPNFYVNAYGELEVDLTDISSSTMTVTNLHMDNYESPVAYDNNKLTVLLDNKTINLNTHGQISIDDISQVMYGKGVVDVFKFIELIGLELDLTLPYLEVLGYDADTLRICI
jgi:hypothetical protein